MGDEDNNAATLVVKGNKVTNGSFEKSNTSGFGPAACSGSKGGRRDHLLERLRQRRVA